MTRRGKIITVLALTATLALGWVLGRDWRPALHGLTLRAEHALGLTIAIDGKVRLALLPLALKAEQIQLRRDDAPLLSAQRLSLRLSLLSLLTGKLDVTGVLLDQVGNDALRLDSVEAHFGDNRLDGFTKLGGHNVTFSATIDPQAGQATSFRLTVPATGAALRFDGAWDSSADGPLVSGHLSLNSGTLAALPAPMAVPLGVQIRAEADLDAGGGQFSLVNIVVDGNGSHGAGQFMALSGQPGLIEGDFSLDRLDLDAWKNPKTPLVPALLGPAVTAPPKTETRGLDGGKGAAADWALPDQLLANLRLDVGELIWHGQSLTDLSVRLGLDQGQVVVRQAELTAPGQLRLNADGVFADQAFRGRLRLNARGLSARADIQAAWPSLALRNIHANRDGLFAQGQLDARWDDGIVSQWRGQIGSLRDTSLSVRLFPSGQGFDAPEFSLKADKLALDGRLSADFSGSRPRLNAALHGGTIDLAAKIVGKSTKAAQKPPRLALIKPQKTKENTTAKRTPFSDKPFDFSHLPAIDGLLTLELETLLGDFGRLDHVDLNVRRSDDLLTIDALTAQWLGAHLDLKGTLKTDGQAPEASVKGRIDGLDLAQIKPTVGAISLEDGRVNLELDVHGRGRSLAEMAAHADGSARISGGPGHVGGFDLGAVNARIAHLDSAGNVLALLQTGMAGGHGKYTSITGTGVIKNGIVGSHDLRLKADGGTLAAEGNLDLGKWSTESTLTLTLDTLPTAPLRLTLSGPVQSPSKVIDANALQKALLQAGLAKVLGAKADSTGAPAEKRPSLSNILRNLRGH